MGIVSLCKMQGRTSTWRTGTSEAAWALRREGKYKEADALLLERARLDDAEALMDLYLLWFHGNSPATCHGQVLAKKQGFNGRVPRPEFRAFFRDATMETGHPVVRAWMTMRWEDERDERDWAQMETLDTKCSPDAISRMFQHPSPTARWRAVGWRRESEFIANPIVQHLARVDRHPLAAFELGMAILRSGKIEDMEVYLRNSADILFYLGIAADQGHVLAACNIARLCFSYDLPCHNVNWGRGARYLVQALAVTPRESSATQLMSERLTLTRSTELGYDQVAGHRAFSPVTNHRLRELYWYGRAAKTDLAFLDMRRENCHPRFVYLVAIKKARSAALAFMHALRMHPVFRRTPKDIVEVLARQVWESRMSYTSEWWNMPTQGLDWTEFRAEN